MAGRAAALEEEAPLVDTPRTERQAASVGSDIGAPRYHERSGGPLAELWCQPVGTGCSSGAAREHRQEAAVKATTATF